METWLKTFGKIKIEEKKASILLRNDFILYYKWFINIEHYNTIPFFTPRYGAHISVILPTIHRKFIERFDLRKELKAFQNKKVIIYYNINALSTFRQDGFVNYWFKVKCDEINRMKYLINIKESEKYLGEHITICSNKHLLKNKL